MTAGSRRRLTIFIAHPSELLTDHRPHGDGLVSFGFIRRLADRGHELHVAAQCVDVESPLPPNVHVYELLPGSRLALGDRVRFMVRMRRLLDRLRRERHFDVMHQMNPVFTGLSLALVGVPTPLVLGAFVPHWNANADAEAARHARGARLKARVLDVLARTQQARADGLLVASPDAVARIARPERHRGHIYEVPHGIDLSRFEARRDPPDRPSILFLANVIYRKGVFTLLDAFERVARDLPEAELVIAGDGHQLDEVRTRAAAMASTRAVRIVGRVARGDVAALMRRASLYCLPSYGEPFGMTVLEAMASGVPVVSTSAGGMRHLVSADGGRLVPPRNPDALAGALVEVLRSPDLQLSMGRHNRARVEAEFEIERTVDRLEEAYYGVIDGVAPDRGRADIPAAVLGPHAGQDRAS